ncbi:addiction module antidote protein, copg/arc/metj family [Asticcacaulis sp. DW145]|jgi:hypothetical protein|uniref:CopG family transcriptional regulator n=1 Tax=Asticcacaulis currens TaxID=2984210 RepID=A0ABT5IEW1_9CAUL|nr:hypothetical protein [Asticcacaulis currens]MDC7694732.1 hypothetical protein [Asticcacaulis currens]BEV11158.1 addiction module antidote protein, copg/arc/metj family [Asticcacaulis sp. DW145]
MTVRLNIDLPDDISAFVDAQSAEGSPADYIRRLIEEDMMQAEVMSSLLRGLNQARRGEVVPPSVLDEIIAELEAAPKE